MASFSLPGTSSTAKLSGEGRAGTQPAHRAPRGEEAEKVPGTLSGREYTFRVFRQPKSHMRTGGGSAQVKDSETPVPSKICWCWDGHRERASQHQCCPTEPSVMAECPVTLLCPGQQPRATCGYSAPEMWPVGLRK